MRTAGGRQEGAALTFLKEKEKGNTEEKRMCVKMERTRRERGEKKGKGNSGLFLLAAAARRGLGAMATMRGLAAGVACSDPARPAGMRGLLEEEDEFKEAAALIIP